MYFTHSNVTHFIMFICSSICQSQRHLQPMQTSASENRTEEASGNDCVQWGPHFSSSRSSDHRELHYYHCVWTAPCAEELQTPDWSDPPREGQHLRKRALEDDDAITATANRQMAFHPHLNTLYSRMHLLEPMEFLLEYFYIIYNVVDSILAFCAA